MSVSRVLACSAYNEGEVRVFGVQYGGVLVCEFPVCWRILHTICGHVCMWVSGVLAYGNRYVGVFVCEFLGYSGVFGRRYLGVFVCEFQVGWL